MILPSFTGCYITIEPMSHRANEHSADCVAKEQSALTPKKTQNKRKLSTSRPSPDTLKKQPPSEPTTATTTTATKINVDEDLQIDIDDIGSTKSPSQMKVNKYIKLLLSQWETTPNADLTLIKETKKALFPILVKLRKGTTPADQLTSMLTIFYHLQRDQFMKANESYMKLSIGNVAWPIGVVNVSIHARSAQTRTNDGGSNIMIDEATRKWITGIKRLITFRETNHYNKGSD